MRYFLLLCICAYISQTLASIGGHISTSDQDRLKVSLEKALIASAPEDLASIYYSARGYTFLKKDVPPIVVKTSCNVLSKAFSPTLSLENVFYIVSTWAEMKCPGKLDTKDIITKIKASLSNDKANTAEIYYGLENLYNMGEKITEVQKLAQILQARLKTDDSLMNFGFAFHAATRLGASGQFAYDRIEDIIVQADEIDGKMLQFEGGLGVTSLLLSGIVRLAETLKKPLPLTQIQIDKFANYLLSRRSVQTTKGISCLIEATKALTDTKSLTPVCISVLGSGVVTTDKPALGVKICDMLGKPLANSEVVIAQSATRLADDVVVLSKQKLVATKDPTLYELELKHKPGKYRIVVTAGANSASLSATVLGTVNVDWLEIGVSDTDQGSPSKLQKIAYASKLGQILEADNQQRLLIKFSLGGKSVHQAFVRLECQQTSREIIFVAEINSNAIYVFDMDIGSKATELGIKSGKYNIELIIGDAIINNPFRWTIAETNLRIGGPGAQSTPPSIAPIRGMRPEIVHMFREPEIRPLPVISTLFTFLVVAPLLVLFAIWIKLGINVSNFKFSLSALLFHSGLGGIFGLFFVFWWKLDMFTTCRWLLLVGLVTFLAGHRLLSSIAAQKKH